MKPMTPTRWIQLLAGLLLFGYLAYDNFSRGNNGLAVGMALMALASAFWTYRGFKNPARWERIGQVVLVTILLGALVRDFYLKGDMLMAGIMVAGIVVIGYAISMVKGK